MLLDLEVICLETGLSIFLYLSAFDIFYGGEIPILGFLTSNAAD